MLSLRWSRGRGPRRFALVPAVALACAALAVPYLATPRTALADSVTQLDIASFSDTGIPTVGLPLQLAVIPSNANHDRDTCFSDTVHFADAYAIVPADYTFQAINWGIFCTGDQGMYFFEMTPLRPGPQTMTVTDLNHPSITGTLSIDVLPGAAASFTLTPLKATARTGSPAGFELTVRDAYGFVATNYTGTVHFTSNDSAAVLPTDCTFNADDAGSRVVLATFNTTGTRSLTATAVGNGSLTASANISVAGAPHFDIQLDAQAWAGMPTQFIVTAQNDDGTTDLSYRGTVHFGSSDLGADVPIDYTFTSTLNGSFSWNVTFTTAGTQTFTATDTLNSNITGVGTSDVVGGDPVSATLTGLPSVMVAGPVTVTVTQTDAFGNNASGGMVHFSTTDTRAIRPADFTFHVSDHGTHQFQLTLETAGLSGVTIHGGYGGGFSVTQSTTVVHGAAAKLTVNGISNPAAAGVGRTVAVRATDTYGNTDPGYHGTVHLTSTDAKAVLPADYAFVSADSGSHVFPVTLKTAGSQTVRARDTVVSTIAGLQTVSVTPRLTKTLSVSTANPYVAGVGHTVTVTALDPYGNVATSYAGTIHISSSDPAAVLPADYTFVAADKGIHRLTLTLKTAGSRSVTATDTATAKITGSQTVSVTPGAVRTFVVSTANPYVAGVTHTLTVTAKDPYGNTATGYTGTIHVTSSDPAAKLPADYTFIAADKGVHRLLLTLKTAGTQWVRASDTITPKITGAQTGIVVS